mgnify:CR=1 FL=1
MIWFLYLPLDIVTSLLAFPLSPIICLFADGQGDVTLSKKNPLRLWLTPDNPIEGDRGHFERWADFVKKHPKIGPYIQRVFWLWRNKAYGWSWKVLNAFIPAGQEIKQWGDHEVGDKPYKSGYWVAVTKNAWMLYLTFPTLPGKCFRLYMGWKLRSACLYRINKQPKDYNAMFVCSLNPVKSRV